MFFLLKVEHPESGWKKRVTTMRLHTRRGRWPLGHKGETSSVFFSVSFSVSVSFSKKSALSIDKWHILFVYLLIFVSDCSSLRFFLYISAFLCIWQWLVSVWSISEWIWENQWCFQRNDSEAENAEATNGKLGERKWFGEHAVLQRLMRYQEKNK